MDKIKNELLKAASELALLRLQKEHLEGYVKGLNFILDSQADLEISKVADEEEWRDSPKKSVAAHEEVIDSEFPEVDEVEPEKENRRKGVGRMVGPLSEIYQENERIFEKVKFILSQSPFPMHYTKVMEMMGMKTTSAEKRNFRTMLYTRCNKHYGLRKFEEGMFSLNLPKPKPKESNKNHSSLKTEVYRENEKIFEKIKEALKENAEPLHLSEILEFLKLEDTRENRHCLTNIMRVRLKQGREIIRVQAGTWGLKGKNYSDVLPEVREHHIAQPGFEENEKRYEQIKSALKHSEVPLNMSDLMNVVGLKGPFNKLVVRSLLKSRLSRKEIMKVDRATYGLAEKNYDVPSSFTAIPKNSRVKSIMGEI